MTKPRIQRLVQAKHTMHKLISWRMPGLSICGLERQCFPVNNTDQQFWLAECLILPISMPLMPNLITVLLHRTHIFYLSHTGVLLSIYADLILAFSGIHKIFWNHDFLHSNNTDEHQINKLDVTEVCIAIQIISTNACNYKSQPDTQQPIE